MAIVKTAGMFLGDVKSVLVVPICTNMCALMIMVLWLIGFIYIYSSGDVVGQAAVPYATVTLTNN